MPAATTVTVADVASTLSSKVFPENVGNTVVAKLPVRVFPETITKLSASAGS